MPCLSFTPSIQILTLRSKAGVASLARASIPPTCRSHNPSPGTRHVSSSPFGRTRRPTPWTCKNRRSHETLDDDVLKGLLKKREKPLALELTLTAAPPLHGNGRGMTKKAPPLARRHVASRFSWKLLIAVCISFSLCAFALFKLHCQSELSSVTLSHRRSRISREKFDGPPKIAFLFLVRQNLPLDFLWGTFFENGDASNFSIYIHSAPGFVFDESTTRSHFFYGRQLRNSIQVLWGESSMIEAEKLLLAAALEDPANQRFVLLSDSCVPLYNFTYVYNYIMVSPKSFVDSFLDVKEGRYNPKMSPKIPREKWRKGSQWITLIRSHAEVIADDEVIFSVFKKYCKRRPPVDARKGKLNLKLQKQHNCIPDEHYVQTLLAMYGFEGELERRTVTYTVWNQSATKMENKGWHPMTFSYATASPQRIKEIKDVNHVYYETEYRTEWCRVNSTSVPCFLFARKFSRGAAMRLLSDDLVGHFEVAKLLDTHT